MSDDTTTRPSPKRGSSPDPDVANTKVGLKHDQQGEDDDQGADDKDADNEGGDKDDGDKDGKKRSKLPLIILAIVVVLAAIAGGIYWFLTRNQVGTDDAYTDGRSVLIAPQVNGYVVALAVNDNQFVHKGALLVQIDPRPYQAAQDEAEGKLAQSQAQLVSARVNLEKAKVTYPAMLAQAKGQLAQVEGQLYQAEADFKRQHAIARGATSQQSIDQSTAGQRSAQGQVEAARAQVAQAELIPQNIAQAEADVRQLEGQVEQMKGQFEAAKLNLGYAHVTAPQDGPVTRRNVEMGNYLQSGQQIMALVTPDVWVTANFKETELNGMHPGQRVAIAVDAYPDLHLEGHVDSIQKGSGSKFSAFPAENATGNFVKIVQRVPVKIVIDRGLPANWTMPLGISVVPTVYLK